MKNLEYLFFLVAILLMVTKVTRGAITSVGREETIDIGQNATFTCNTDDGKPVSWRQYLMNITVDMPTFVVESNTLTIIGKNIGVLGNYTCFTDDDVRKFALFVNFKNTLNIVRNHTIMIGQTTQEIQINLSSYPEITNVFWTNGRNTYHVSTDRYTLKNTTINMGGFSYYQTYRLNIQKVDESDIGDFLLNYTFQGKDFQDLAARFIKGGCYEPLTKCRAEDKCISQEKICDNKQDCSDFSDEDNCNIPSIVIDQVLNKGFTEFTVTYRFSDQSSNQKNFTIKYNVTTSDKEELIVSDTTHHYQVLNYPSNLVIKGVRNSTTYNISMRVETVSGKEGATTTTSFQVPVPEKPVIPEASWINHRNYSTIRIRLNEFSPSWLSYIVTYSLFSNGTQIGNSVVSFLPNGKPTDYISLGAGTLKNGTTYQIIINARTDAGLAEPKIINYTIPRMAPPGPVLNLKVGKVTPTKDYVWLQLWFDRPTDDGQDGAPSLSGKLKYCEVLSNDNLLNCKEETFFIADDGKKAVSPLKEKTKYYFEITLKNKLDQYGATVGEYYTTPSYTSTSSGGLSGGAIAGIVCGCLGVLLVAIGACWKKNQSSNDPGSVSYSKS
ncbi:uncharacterized protein [Clytia hemisphaerica]|uniref:Fibronectin type-III domain-containing protein n=1 Tax=Clytia hemisphaerica TaxID=252671 RepID=A0A7M5UTT1_9CNID